MVIVLVVTIESKHDDAENRIPSCLWTYLVVQVHSLARIEVRYKRMLIYSSEDSLGHSNLTVTKELD